MPACPRDKGALKGLDEASLKATANTACKGRFPDTMGDVEVILHCTNNLERFFGYQRITGPVLRIYLQKKGVPTDSRAQRKELAARVKQLWNIRDSTATVTSVDRVSDVPKEKTVDEGGRGPPSTSGSPATTQRGKRSASPRSKPSNSKKQEAEGSVAGAWDPDTERDQYQIHGELVAKRIRSLPPSVRSAVRHEIDCILFKAEQAAEGKCHSPQTQIKIQM